MAALLHPSSVQCHGARACRLVAMLATVCLLLLSGSCDAARRLHNTPTTPWSYIKSTPGLEILASLVQAANLSSTLDNASLNFTFFLPNNQSFAYLQSEQNTSVAELINSPALRGVLLYHVFPGAALSPTGLAIGKKLVMANGDNVTITAEPEVGIPVALVDAMGRAAAPVVSNITLGTSIGYVISKVLLPITPATLSEALSYESSMSQIYTILRLVAASETGDDKTFTNLLYSNKTNVTFLVPTDDAFSSMCVNVSWLASNPVYLKKLLLSHFLSKSLDFQQLVNLDGFNVSTLVPGVGFEVQVMYGTIILYGHNTTSTLIMTPDLVAGPSFMHSINTLLLPSDPSKPDFSCPPAPPSDDYVIRNNYYDNTYYDPPAPPSTDGN